MSDSHGFLLINLVAQSLQQSGGRRFNSPPGPVVRRVDSAIQWMTQLVFLVCICWIVIFIWWIALFTF